MKKSLLGLLAFAGMLASTSCSNDVELITGKDTTVSFAVKVDNVAATRAVSDGTTVDILYYEVYDQNGTTLVTEGNVDVENLQATIENVPLVSGNTYQVAFWAQSTACTMYDTDDLRNVTVDYEGVTNNNENMDAFCAALTSFTVTGNGITQPVTLTRPFAQVNVGAPVVNNLGIQQSSVTVNKYYTSLNILSGEAGDLQETNLTFALADVATGDDNYFTVNGANYAYLSTTYLLSNEEGENLDLNFQFTGDKNYTLDYSNTPVKRNYRTNILTNQTEDMVNFTITVDPNYINPDTDLEDGDLQQTENLVTVSDVTAEVSGDQVQFSASYTGEVETAYFVCSPVTRAAENVVEVEATANQGTISATAATSQFESGVSYIVTVKVNGNVVPATGEPVEPITPNGGSTGPEQPGEETYKLVTVTPSSWVGEYVLAYVANNACVVASELSAPQGTSGFLVKADASHYSSTDNTLSGEYSMLTIEQVGSYYALSFDGKYLGWTSGNTFAFSTNKPTDSSDSYLWSISLSDNNVVMTCKKLDGSDNRTLQYNASSGSERFSVYKTSQKPVCLFAK